MKLLSPVFVVTLFLSAFFAISEGDFIHDFLNPRLRHTPRFPDSQLYRLEGDAGFGGVQGSIGCFGDFNSDKYTDVFVISENRTVVDVYLWDSDAWKFKILPGAHVETPNITNIAASDFNHDGKLDLLVMGDNIQEYNGTITHTTYIKLYNGDITTINIEPNGPVPDALDQVLVLDANNDLYPDLFGELPGDPPRRTYWINNHNGGFDTREQDGPGPALARLAKPHSNGFADFNGDCMADLFVTSLTSSGSKQYEIWINHKNGLGLKSTAILPEGSGQVTFADFDGDGTLDFCVPVCNPSPTCETDNYVRIVYNKQKPLCTLLGSKSGCRKATDLCSADESFQLGDATQPVTDAVDGISTLSFGSMRFAFDNANDRPLTIRTGDFNLDGYADLIIPVRDANSNVSRIELWDYQLRRGFIRHTDGVGALTSVQNAYAAALFDLDEDGNSDLLALVDNPPGIVVIFNNFQNDAFFLKAVGLNGVCTGWCPSPLPKFPSPKPYGVNFRGGTFKFTISDMSGKTHVAIGAQLPQSSYLALNLPYVMFGLGRTSNYIEEFFYGIPINNDVHYQKWTGNTIPNSQVVAIPYKPNEPTGWTVELYTNPSGIVFWVIISVLASVIILSAIVFILYRKEKREDEKFKQDVAHLFSFDAL